MFEAISFRSGGTPDGKIDFGLLAESLVFYGRVHFISNHAGYSELLRVIGPYETLELLRRNQLEIHVAANQLGILTLDRGTARERHDFAYFSLADADPPNEASKRFAELAGISPTDSAAKAFASKLHYIAKQAISFPPVRKSVLEDPNFGPTVVSWLRQLAPESVPGNSRVETWTLGKSIQLATSFDLDRVAQEIRRKHPSIQFDPTHAWLLENYGSVIEDSYYASQLSAEVSTSFVRGPLLQSRFEHLWQRATESREEIHAFEEKTLRSGRAVGEALLSGTATWADLLGVLEERERFRQWIANKPFDADLAADYVTELSRQTWLDKLPGKTMRWATMTSAGVIIEAILPTGIGLVASQGLGAIDALVLDRFLKGWKPDQFINDSLAPLVKKPDEG